jgi:hypothetical protein
MRVTKRRGDEADAALDGYRPSKGPTSLAMIRLPRPCCGARARINTSTEAMVDDRNELLRELMAVFDELPAALREAINYAPEPLNPKELAALCRRHGAENVLAMIELKLKRRARPTGGGKSG